MYLKVVNNMKGITFSNRLNKYIVQFRKNNQYFYVGIYNEYDIALQKLMESKNNHDNNDNNNLSIFSSNFTCNRPKLKCGNVEYALYHIGIENQYAYHNMIVVSGKKYYVELVNHPKRGWSYHIERYGVMIHDSLISNTYFENNIDAHKKVISLLLKK